MAIVRDLTQVTPVDTSQAISNWQTAINTRPSAPIRAYVYGSKGSSRLASATIANEHAERLLVNAKPVETIYISNVLPYIKKLNDGSSAQAPAGFIERSILIGRLEARK